MGTIFPRGERLYARIKDVGGTWRQAATGFRVDERDKAVAWVREREREVVTARALAPGGALTVHRYAESWLKRRTNKTVKDDRTRLELHVLPRIGSILLVDVRPRHLRDIIEELKREGKLAPKTIRSVSGIMHSLFKSAVIDEAIVANPCVFERGVLPKKTDKDPTWRAQAIYTRGEIERLLSDQGIPPDRRALYAMKFFVGRHGEVSRLTWANYDADAKPLGAIHLGVTKSGVPRAVPVHRTLAKVLAAWKLGGWEKLVGREPKAEDLIVPTRNGTRRAAAESQHQLVADLAELKMRTEAGERRKRRGHDLRRTLITLARSDGALDSILRLITHGPRPNEMLDVYSTPPWEVLCGEIAKLKIELREGAVVKLSRAR